MTDISIYIIPSVIALFITAGVVRKVRVFDSFIDGAKSGIPTIISVIPTLVGLITAVEMFKASGALDMITSALLPVTNLLGLPAEAVPMALLRPISGSGSIALLNSILGTCGPDTFAGRTASVLCGASETTFYTISVYCGAVGIKKTRHILAASLISDAASALFSALAVRIFFG